MTCICTVMAAHLLKSPEMAVVNCAQLWNQCVMDFLAVAVARLPDEDHSEVCNAHLLFL